MKIAMLEPLSVSNDIIEKLSQGLKDKGHEFVAYDTVTNDVEELKRRAEGAEAIIIANNPLPGEVIKASDNHLIILSLSLLHLQELIMWIRMLA